MNELPNLFESEALIWELQYLWSEDEKSQWSESENKLRLIRALIKAGANPNLDDCQQRKRHNLF